MHESKHPIEQAVVELYEHLRSDFPIGRARPYPRQWDVFRAKLEKLNAEFSVAYQGEQEAQKYDD